MCEIFYQRQKSKNMKKAISVILFIIVARFCDGQALGAIIQYIPPSQWVIDTPNVMLKIPMKRVIKDSTHAIIDSYNGSFQGLEVFKIPDNQALIIYSLSQEKGYGLTLIQCDSIIQNQ